VACRVQNCNFTSSKRLILIYHSKEGHGLRVFENSAKQVRVDWKKLHKEFYYFYSYNINKVTSVSRTWKVIRMHAIFSLSNA
jgi:hypothetical protein